MSSIVSTIPTPNPTSSAWSVYIDNQGFNLTSLNGNETTISLSVIDSWTKVLIAQTALYGVSCGATGLLMIVLLVYTDKKKTRQPLFIVNFLSLLVQCSRNIITIAENCNAQWYGVGQIWLGGLAQYSVADSTFRTIIFVVINPVFYGLIFASLILQIRAIFPTHLRLQKNILTGVLTVAACALLACWTSYQVFVVMSLFNWWDSSRPVPWLYTTVQVGVTIFVGITCLSLVLKFYIAVRRRHRLGLYEMTPFHVLLITSTQCLVIPLILFILNLTLQVDSPYVNLNVVGQTFLICSFPVSALWAKKKLGECSAFVPEERHFSPFWFLRDKLSLFRRSQSTLSQDLNV